MINVRLGMRYMYGVKCNVMFFASQSCKSSMPKTNSTTLHCTLFDNFSPASAFFKTASMVNARHLASPKFQDLIVLSCTSSTPFIFQQFSITRHGHGSSNSSAFDGASCRWQDMKLHAAKPNITKSIEEMVK